MLMHREIAVQLGNILSGETQGLEMVESHQAEIHNESFQVLMLGMIVRLLLLYGFP